VEDDAMRGFAEEGGARLARGQDARLALDAEVEVAQARDLGNPADERLGAMGVEVVGNDVPADSGQVGGDDSLEVGQEISRGPGRSSVRGDNPPGDDVAAEDERARPVADVLKLAPLHLAGRER
jgi:hypothetical protein